MKEAFKKYMKGSAKKAELPPPPPEPRDLATINSAYTDLCGRLGQAQYRLKVLEADINTFLNQIAELDREGRDRMTKDKATEDFKKLSEQDGAKNEQSN